MAFHDFLIYFPFSYHITISLHIANNSTPTTIIQAYQSVTRYELNWLRSVQNLKMARKIRYTAKHNSHWSFTSDTHQSGTSEQSLIGTKVEDGEKHRKRMQHNNYTVKAFRQMLIRVVRQKYDRNEKLNNFRDFCENVYFCQQLWSGHWKWQWYL